MGLFAWGSGSLVQIGLDAVTQMAPVLVFGIVAAVASAPRLDLLALGDDTAAVLGLGVRRTRVARHAAGRAARRGRGHGGRADRLRRAVSHRPSSGWPAPAVPGLLRHRALLPISGSSGRGRRARGGRALRALSVPRPGSTSRPASSRAGVGALFLSCWPAGTATRVRPGQRRPAPAPACGPGGPSHRLPRSSSALVVGRARGGARRLSSATPGCSPATSLNWLNGRSGPRVDHVRARPAAAASARGACSPVRRSRWPGRRCRRSAATRWPSPASSASPRGAGVGRGRTADVRARVPGVADVGGRGCRRARHLRRRVRLSWRGGLNSDRLVLIGVGVSAGLAAAHDLLIVVQRPVERREALTWLSGRPTAGRWRRSCRSRSPLLLLTPLLCRHRRELDLLALDDDTAPRARRPAGADPADRSGRRGGPGRGGSLPRSAWSGSSGWSPRTPPGRSSAAGTGG